MSRSRIPLALGGAIALLLLSGVPSVFASGGYTAPTSHTPEQKVYHQGKDIALGFADLPTEAISEERRVAQAEELEGIAKHLEDKKVPQRVRDRVSAERLAGRLDDEQMAALRKYLTVRYLGERYYDAPADGAAPASADAEASAK